MLEANPSLVSYIFNTLGGKLGHAARTAYKLILIRCLNAKINQDQESMGEMWLCVV